MNRQEAIFIAVAFSFLLAFATFFHSTYSNINEERNKQEKENLSELFEKLSIKLKEMEEREGRRNKEIIEMNEKVAKKIVEESLKQQISTLIDTVSFSIRQEMHDEWKRRKMSENVKEKKVFTGARTINITEEKLNISFLLPKDLPEEIIKEDILLLKPLAELIESKTKEGVSERPLFVQVGGQGLLSVAAALAGARSVALVAEEITSFTTANAERNNVASLVNVIKKREISPAFSEDIFILVINERSEEEAEALNSVSELCERACVKHIWLRSEYKFVPL